MKYFPRCFSPKVWIVFFLLDWLLIKARELGLIWQIMVKIFLGSQDEMLAVDSTDDIFHQVLRTVKKHFDFKAKQRTSPLLIRRLFLVKASILSSRPLFSHSTFPIFSVFSFFFSFSIARSSNRNRLHLDFFWHVTNKWPNGLHFLPYMFSGWLMRKQFQGICCPLWLQLLSSKW